MASSAFSSVKKTLTKMAALGKMNGSVAEDASPPTAASSSDAVAHQQSSPADIKQVQIISKRHGTFQTRPNWLVSIFEYRAFDFQGSDLQTAKKKTSSSSYPNHKKERRYPKSRFWFLNPLKPQKNDEPPQKKNQQQIAGRNSTLHEDMDAAGNRFQRRDQTQRRSSWRYPHGSGGGRFYGRGEIGNPNNYHAWEDEYERRGRYMPRLGKGRTGGTHVRDNEVIGYDPSEVVIGERNWGGRRTGGRVSGNVVIR